MPFPRCQVCMRIRNVSRTFRMVGLGQSFIESSWECKECIVLSDKDREQARNFYHSKSLICGLCCKFPCSFERTEYDEACEVFDYKQPWKGVA